MESTSGSTGSPAPAAGGARAYAGRVRWAYRPQRNGRPDPGEIVWVWVAFEEDPSVGKDRPVVVIGLADRKRLAALLLSSRDHSGDPRWLPIGAGAWDDERRPSWVRRDRLLAVEPRAVRREGATLPSAAFESIRSSIHARKLTVLQRLRRTLLKAARRSPTL